MKKLFYLAILCAFSFVPFTQLSASHLVGGEISYQCLGANQYKISLTVYRDCSNSIPVSFDAVANLSFFKGDSTAYNISSTNVVNVVFDPNNYEVIPLTIANTCLVFSSASCLDKATYETTVTLPYDASGYFISYQRCCRSNVLTNVGYPSQTGMTISTFISDEAQIGCKSSPVFNSQPPVAFCNNIAMDFDASATDLDGDSLVYSFCAPFSGGTLMNPLPSVASPPPYNTIFYNNGFSTLQPIAGNISIDAQTGMVSGLPTASGFYTIGIRVDKYQNSTWIGQAKRDFTIGIIDCQPAFTAGIIADTIDTSGNFVINSCNPSVELSVPSTLLPFIDSLYWEVTLAPGNIVTSNSPIAVVNFPGLGSYPGLLIARSDTLSCQDTANIIVNIVTDTSLTATFNYSYDSTIIDPITFQGIATSNDSIVSWHWDFGDGNTSNLQNPVYAYQDSGTYIVTLTVTTLSDCSTQYAELVEWMPIPILLSTQSVDLRHTLKLYPNPSNDYVQITGFMTDELIEAIEIVDNNGRLISVEQTPNQNRLSVETLGKGVYWLRIFSNKRMETLKLVVL